MTGFSTRSTTQQIITRPFQNDDDFWRARDLSIVTYPITGPGFNWDIRRWDGWRFYNADPSWRPEWEQQIRVWETEAGQIVGVVHPDGPGWPQLELHPDYRDAIEDAMIDWAEEHHAAPTADGQSREIWFVVYDYDRPRRQRLEKRGYQPMPDGGIYRRMFFGNKPLPVVALADGYTLRTTRPDEGDFQRVADLVNAAFGRTFHNAGEYRSFTRLAPSFCFDLDLVAEAPDGSFAALVGVIYDEVNRRGLFEPVCTHPDHRRLGLAQALMFEGLHRLKALGAVEVTVETGLTNSSNYLYDSIGFTEAYECHVWHKMF